MVGLRISVFKVNTSNFESWFNHLLDMKSGLIVPCIPQATGLARKLPDLGSWGLKGLSYPQVLLPAQAHGPACTEVLHLQEAGYPRLCLCSNPGIEWEFCSLIVCLSHSGMVPGRKLHIYKGRDALNLRYHI